MIHGNIILGAVHYFMHVLLIHGHSGGKMILFSCIEISFSYMKVSFLHIEISF